MARCGQDLGFHRVEIAWVRMTLALKPKVKRCGFSQKKEKGAVKLGFGIRVLGIFFGLSSANLWVCGRVGPGFRFWIQMVGLVQCYLHCRSDLS